MAVKNFCAIKKLQLKKAIISPKDPVDQPRAGSDLSLARNGCDMFGDTTVE